MWLCPNCYEDLQESLYVCRVCGSARDKVPDLRFSPERERSSWWNEQVNLWQWQRIGSEADYAAQRRIHELASGWCLHSASLMPYRAEFKTLVARQPIPGLVFCVADADPRVQKLALWLLGRCRRRKVLPVMMTLRGSPHRGVRKELAKAVRRLGAWKELSNLAQQERDPQICRLATASPPTPFTARLARFTRNSSTDPAASTTRLAFRLFVRLPLGPGRPPKDRWHIRAILERIRAVLQG